jgi:hypothetical protein
MPTFGLLVASTLPMPASLLVLLDGLAQVDFHGLLQLLPNLVSSLVL